MKNSTISEANINHKINYIFDEWYNKTPLGYYKKGEKARIETQIIECLAEPFNGIRNLFQPYPISENKMLLILKLLSGGIQIMDNY